MFVRPFLFAFVAAALVSISQSASPEYELPLESPCPELFDYEDVSNRGYWTGNLILRPDYDLSGVWIRLIFDKEVKDLTVDHDFVVKHDPEDKKLVKLQNKDLIANAGITKILKIKVTYEGSEMPDLIEYRLNARTICPQASRNRSDTFHGDLSSNYFLPSLHNQPEVHPTKYQCGVPKVSDLYPWQASLYIHRFTEDVYACEAILISPNHLVTAAHCVTFKNESNVVPRAFVRLHLGSTTASVDVEKKSVRDIIVHPGYQAGSLQDDIAILHLVHPVDTEKDLLPICLGSMEVKPDDKIFITGYEIGAYGNIIKLLESNVTKINTEECTKLSPHLENALTYDTFCVSYNSDDKFCVGDSGSALISINGGRSVLRGIVTIGFKLQHLESCDANSNAVVTDIRRYISWINNVIYNNNF